MRISFAIAVALATLGCGAGLDCYEKPEGAPDIELREGFWSSANCTKSFSTFQRAYLELPGVHAFGTDPDWPGNWPGCENWMSAEAIMDESGLVVDYEIALSSPLLPELPAMPGRPAGPNPFLIPPRITNVVTSMIFRPHVPTKVTIHALAEVDGLGFEKYGHFLGLQVSETPARRDGPTGNPYADPIVSLYEQRYRDPLLTVAGEFTRRLEIPTETFELEPGADYLLMLVADLDGYVSGDRNFESDVLVTGTARLELEPGEAQQCGR